ncbi:hypothetical protein [Actinomadura sp. NBRC 104425]|uniref:hypothetical protein n=1 Tax=Actinomadura sp. NBRC 104425 TaxID=3032204 RepID=UPI00255759A1|nr:hypothetical protein [Actinomadura sp. NBRC 104425]
MTLRSIRRLVTAVLLVVLVVSAQVAPGPVVALADAGGDCPGARPTAPADHHCVPGDEEEADENEIGDGGNKHTHHGKGRKKHRRGGEGKNWSTTHASAHHT